MSSDILASFGNEVASVSSQMAVVTLTAPADKGRDVVVLLNGRSCGTLANGSLLLAVCDGDIIELDCYSRDAVIVTVRSTDRHVILPVPGQKECVQNDRTVLARVLLRK